MQKDFKNTLGLKSHPAQFWKSFNDNAVECFLCPRHCKLKSEQYGFCQVRKNEDSKLVTLNYGVSVQMTQEFIETEACNHFTPGAAILSLGNVGCMMACDFCHNWQTSQMKYVEKKEINFYTPEQIVQAALDKGIGMLSWTYNDPVVWQEFVVDTARLAKKHGIKNLYKSAFYIGSEAIDQLHEVMDIFSISLKSMDPVFYSKITKGKLQPVLDGIKQVYNYGDSHLELSNLVVTGRNDTIEEIKKVVDWMLANLDDKVPLHIVRFHPDFKYTHVERTSIPFLIQAREVAKQMGLKHVYLGNVYQENEGLLTRCEKCTSVLVNRFGLSIDVSGMTATGACVKCGHQSDIKCPPLKERKPSNSKPNLPAKKSEFVWHGDINACHVGLENTSSTPSEFVMEYFYSDATKNSFKAMTLAPGEKWRMIASRSAINELGVRVHFNDKTNFEFFEVKDRAHFPTHDGEQSAVLLDQKMNDEKSSANL